MRINKGNSKIDNGGAKKVRNVATTASAKIPEVVGAATHAGAQAADKVEQIAKKSGQRLQETAEKASHVVEGIAEKVVHAGQETAQKVIDRAKDMATRAGYRGRTWRQSATVSDLMTSAVKSCGIHDTLQRAAQIMWENDCGVVPIVDDDGRLVGMITDRDICMAAYTQGQTLSQIHVSNAMAKDVHAVREIDPVEAAEDLMRRVRVRRVPVLDGEGRLKGILSMNDLARHADHSFGRKAKGLSGDSITETLAAICERHDAPSTNHANVSQRSLSE
jgi:CBS domain-containing protein